MLPEEAYFSVQETLTSPTPDWTKRSNYSSAPPTFASKKGAALFLGTLGRIAFYISAKIKGPNPYIDEYVREDAAHPLASKKIGIEGVEPSSQFPADYFENKVKLEFEGKSYPTPAESDKVFTIRYGGWSQLPPENDCIAHGVVVEPRNVSQSPKTSPLPMPTKLE